MKIINHHYCTSSFVPVCSVRVALSSLRVVASRVASSLFCMLQTLVLFLFSFFARRRRKGRYIRTDDLKNEGTTLLNMRASSLASSHEIEQPISNLKSTQPIQKNTTRTRINLNSSPHGCAEIRFIRIIYILLSTESAECKNQCIRQASSITR